LFRGVQKKRKSSEFSVHAFAQEKERWDEDCSEKGGIVRGEPHSYNCLEQEKPSLKFDNLLWRGKKTEGAFHCELLREGI